MITFLNDVIFKHGFLVKERNFKVRKGEAILGSNRSPLCQPTGNSISPDQSGRTRRYLLKLQRNKNLPIPELMEFWTEGVESNLLFASILLPSPFYGQMRTPRP